MKHTLWCILKMFAHKVCNFCSIWQKKWTGKKRWCTAHISHYYNNPQPAHSTLLVLTTLTYIWISLQSPVSADSSKCCPIVHVISLEYIFSPAKTTQQQDTFTFLYKTKHQLKQHIPSAVSLKQQIFDHSANLICLVSPTDHLPPGQRYRADPSSGPNSARQPPLSLPSE